VQSTCKNDKQIVTKLRPSCEMQGLLFEGKGERHMFRLYMLFGSKISLEI
jgi:hypothetical protein